MLCVDFFFFFFFNDTATPDIYTPLYTLSLHDALPISRRPPRARPGARSRRGPPRRARARRRAPRARSEEHTSELQSHSGISYAVFCLKKKKIPRYITPVICSDIKKNNK